MEFVRQRSNFILGWHAAAARGASVTEGVSAGAVGHAGVPALGSWMILPDLTSPATQTVLPSNDALYGAAQVELDMLGPVVISVPANLDDRYYSVAVMDAHMNNVAHIGPRWTGNGAGDFLLVPPRWQGVAPDGMPVIESPTVSVTLYNRMIVEYDDGDLDRVRQWQAGLGITRLSVWSGDSTGPVDVEVDSFVHPDINTMTSAAEYLRIGLDHLRRNPMAEGAGWLCDMVEAGLGGASVRERWESAIEKGVDAGTALIDAALTTWPRRDGWMVPDPALGLANSQVVRSAAFQQFMIGANDVSDVDLLLHRHRQRWRPARWLCRRYVRAAVPRVGTSASPSWWLLVRDHVRRAQPPGAQCHRSLLHADHQARLRPRRGWRRHHHDVGGSTQRPFPGELAART
jgi:hypothetical protein